MTKARGRAQDIRNGVVGAFGALVNLATPLLRQVRSRWGLAEEEAARAYPGDDLVPRPTWSWTHAVDIAADASAVWPWVVQIGQDKAGFYSYQWLENLAGCEIENASCIHEDWQALSVGDALKLHPKAPPLTVAAIEPGRWFVVTSDIDMADASPSAEPEARVSWLFLVERLEHDHCRLISRFRIEHVKNTRASLNYGPWLTESIGFVMDRAMLLGVKRRAESRH